jgi:hypothetical protein
LFIPTTSQTRPASLTSRCDGRTRLVSHTTYKPEELRKVLDMGMEPGISETFDKLEEYLGRKIIVADLESAAEGKE